MNKMITEIPEILQQLNSNIKKQKQINNTTKQIMKDVRRSENDTK